MQDVANTSNQLWLRASTVPECAPGCVGVDLSHSRQIGCAGTLAYDDGAHSVQLRLPSRAEKEPTPHGAQLDRPVVGANRPSGLRAQAQAQA